MDMLTVQKLHQVMVEVTTDCNLRCSYCSVSQPTWKFRTLNQDLANRLIDEIKILEPFIVHIHGHGETTIIDWWCEYANKLLDSNIKVSICTNLSKTLSDVEIDTLSRLFSITVSLDTINSELLSKLRRGGSIEHVLYNLVRVITKARLAEHRPQIYWSVVVCDKNVMELLELIQYGITLGISGVTFCNLGVGPPLEDVAEVKHVAEMPVEECKTILEMFSTIESYCLQSGIICDIKPGIIDSLNYKIKHGRSHWTIPVRYPKIGNI